MGVDVEEIKKKILPDSIRFQVEMLKSGEFPIGHGAKLKVKNGTIITVLGDNER